VESLRAFFDQRFTKGRNPPRQHSLNALAYLYYNTGEVESSRQVWLYSPEDALEFKLTIHGQVIDEAINLSRTSGDRLALLNIMR
jgi:hypothetical protein